MDQDETLPDGGGVVFERFSDEARFVVVRAQEEAGSLQHREIGTEHLLFGVLRVDDPAVQASSRSLGVTVESVREAVDSAPPKTSAHRLLGRMVRRSPRAPSGHIPFTESARQVLERSLRIAADLHQRTIEPVHLLLALLADPDCRAVQALRATGVDTLALAAAAQAAAADRRP